MARRRLLQQGGRAYGFRQLRARLPGLAGIRLLQLFPVRADRQPARRDRELVPRPLRERARAARGLRRDRIRRHRKFHDHGWRPLVRIRPHLQPAPGIAGGLYGFAAGNWPHADRGADPVDRGRHRRETQLYLSHRRRPDGLRDLVGGLPQRRRQSGAPELDPAARVRVRHAHEHGGGREDGMDGQSPAIQRRGVPDELGRFRRADRRPATRRVPARLRQPADGRDPGHRGRVYFRGERFLADRRDARLQRRARFGGDHADADGCRRRRLRAAKSKMGRACH